MKHYCTFFPDAFFGVYLKEICKRHDIYYASKILTRAQADNQLFMDIYKEKPRLVSAPLAVCAWIVVRLVGKRFYDRAN